MVKKYATNQVILPLDFHFQLEKKDIAFAIDELIESIPEQRFVPFHHQMRPSSYHPTSQLAFAVKNQAAAIETYL